MTQSTGYLLGKALAKMHPALLAAVVGAAGLVVWLVVKTAPPMEMPTTAPTAEAMVAPSPVKSQAEICTETYREVVAEYERLRGAGEHWKAALHVGKCANATKDTQFMQLRTDAEKADRLATIKNPKAADHTRLQAIEAMFILDPVEAAKHKALRDQLVKKMDRAVAARRRSEGIVLGMSKEDVLASSWGKPESVNRSIYAHGEHEQWSYGNRNYVYFRDGKVDSIQTGN